MSVFLFHIARELHLALAVLPILSAPFVDRGLANSIGTGRRGDATFGYRQFQDCSDLVYGEFGFPHVLCSMQEDLIPLDTSQSSKVIA